MKFVTPFFVAFAMIAFLSFGTTVNAHCGACGAEKEKHSHDDKVKKAEDCCSTTAGECCKPDDKAKKAEVKAGSAIKGAVSSFKLPDSSGKHYSLDDYKDKVKVLIFYNQNCPYVVEAYERIDDFAKAYEKKGVTVLAIDAGTNNSTADIAKHQEDVSFPILVNSKSDLARKFDAKRTPEVYVLDKNNKIVYTGMFDSGQNVDDAGNRKTPTKDAVDAVLAGEEVKVPKTKAFGCSIKFKK